MFELLATVLGPPARPDFTNAVNAYGSLVANGLMPLLLAVLGVAAIFALYLIAVRAIRSWFGRSSALSAFGGGGVSYEGHGYTIYRDGAVITRSGGVGDEDSILADYGHKPRGHA